MTTRPSDRATTLTTPEALALLDAEIASCGRLEPEDCENCARIREARAHLASRIAELEGELAAVRANAERYVWLRDNCKREWESCLDSDRGTPSLDIDFDAPGHDLDAAIDAARGAG